MTDAAAPPVQTVRAFERGLRVIRAFDGDHPMMTLAQVARATGLNRATARRLLHTLEELGYVRQRGDTFALTPRVLELGYAFLSSFALPELALPYLEELSDELQEAASVGVLDGTDVVYVARVPAKRVMTVSIGLGSRFPAYRTSLGRALLCDATEEQLRELWEASDRSSPTPRTITDLDGLLQEIDQTRSRGWALVDQELELGVRSLAAPLRDGAGRIVAAMNVSTHASRTTRSELRSRFAPALLRTAQAVEGTLTTRPT